MLKKDPKEILKKVLKFHQSREDDAGAGWSRVKMMIRVVVSRMILEFRVMVVVRVVMVVPVTIFLALSCGVICFWVQVGFFVFLLLKSSVRPKFDKF